MAKIVLEDGKYTVVNELNEGGGLHALRYGEPWRNLAGDNLILAMYHEIESLKKENERLQHTVLEEAIEEAFGERIEINAKKYAEIIRLHEGGDMNA